MEVVVPSGLSTDLRDYIDKRCAKRIFNGVVVEPEKISKLQEILKVVNASQQNMQITYVPNASAVTGSTIARSIKNTQHALAIEVLNSSKAVRPLIDVQMGYLGELVVLELTKLGLGSVWLGGDKIWYNSAEIRKIINSKLPIPLCIAFGYSDQPYVKFQRKPLSIICPQCPSHQQVNAELINRAPSSQNKQLFTIHFNQKTIFLKTERNAISKVVFDYLTSFLDIGIATAHAQLVNGGKIFVVEDGVEVRE
ncbi:Putative_TM nitroreductase [Hexamita inflata]|uniref:TM nitroreductase n=1 Tax=Hexamita inflata TaxID=28002 RepID=A0AA86P2P9_9EUKA|nr:Putative TM nitroreductase [Hexamita inflata]